MRILAIAGGRTKTKGGLGLIGLPYIWRSVADRGHFVDIALAGTKEKGWERWECDKLQFMEFPAVSKWSLSWKLYKYLKSYINNYDIVCLHSIYCFPVWIGSMHSIKCKKPYIVWPHGALASFQRRVSFIKKSVYHKIIINRVMRHASAIVFSNPVEYMESCMRGQMNRICSISEGIDISEFSVLPDRGSFRRHWGISDEKKVILFLARINLKKGLELLLSAMDLAFSEMPGSVLVIAGPGDPVAYENKIKNQVLQCSWSDRIIFTGRLDGVQKLQAYRDADVFVLPSLTENFGFSIFEAMAAGLPVVISKNLSNAQIIEKSGAGLTPSRTPEAFAAAMIKLLTDSKLGQSMGEAGRKLVKSYSWEVYGEKLEHLLLSLQKRNIIPSDLAIHE